MKRNSWNILISTIFLSVFLIKMGLSIAPLIIKMDKETVNAVIMQLELENQGKDVNENLKDINKGVKKSSEYFSDFDFKFSLLSTDTGLSYYFKARPYINSFFPSVLTPPPNHG